MKRLNNQRIKIIGHQRGTGLELEIEKRKRVPYYHNKYLSGKGFNFVDPIHGARPLILKRFISDEGNTIIKSIQICRQPINATFVKLLNFITRGQSSAHMQKMGYDNLFHLYMVLTLANGKKYTLEKNERVNVSPQSESGENGECTQIIDVGDRTVSQFIENAESRNIPGFYSYDAFTSNCQKWISDLLQSNGINNFNSFIVQNVGALAPKYAKRLAYSATKVAAIVDYFRKGGSYL